MSFSIEKHILDFSDSGRCCSWCQCLDDIALHIDDWGCFDKEYEGDKKRQIVEKEKKVRFKTVILRKMGLGDYDKLGSIFEGIFVSKPKISKF